MTNATQPMFSEQTKADCMQLIEMALIEDISQADVIGGTCCTTDAVVPVEATASASFVSRDEGTICGIEVCRAILAKYAPKLKLKVRVEDGERIKQGQTIAILDGSAHEILVVERTCLNFLCKLSGIASMTAKFMAEVLRFDVKVLDTRKTAPGWRRLEKYAVTCGGGTNHRMGLYDAVMIKDNHLAFCRSRVEDKDQTIPTSIELARKWIADHVDELPNGKDTILQIEVDTLEQLEIALKAGPDVVLLDNMDTKQLKQAVDMRNKMAKQVLLEASGGVNLSTIAKIAQTGVERISVGALTHSAKNFDIGLDWTIK